MKALFQWVGERLRFMFLSLLALLISGAGGFVLGRYIASKFGFGRDAEMYFMLGGFVLALVGVALAYERFQQWRFFGR